MNILVTGASGFLGEALCGFLDNKGFSPIRLSSRNCDLTKPDSLLRFNHQAYDLIIHLAAWTQAGDFCLRHPGEQWIINQKINTHILDFWANHQRGAKFIFMGTSCAYAPGSNLVETEYMSGEPIDSLYTYAMTKRMLYQGARALSQQFNLSYLCAVPSTLYGSGYHTDGRQMHFIFDLIRKIIRGKEFGEPVILWGDGHQRREIIHVHDFVRILWDLNKNATNAIFNIGAGEEFTIRTFAAEICQLVGFDPDLIHYDPDRYVGAESKCLSIEKTRSIVDYELTPLTQGLAETIAWFYDKKAF